MTTLEEADWLQKVVDRIDEVGWIAGVVWSQGRQCLVGAAGSVEGFEYSSETLSSPGFSRARDEAENAAANKLLKVLELSTQEFGPNSLEPWWEAVRFNDSHKTWEELRPKLVARIEEIRVGSTEKRLSPEDLFSHIDWEGGVDEAIRYGTNHSEVPIEISQLWAEAEKLLDSFDALASTIGDWLEQQAEVKKILGEDE